ncbi:MAG: YqcC family protein [Candidatus Saccharibacteria bacterium]|nr:YqcC family protein [Moraxellaceae bacterium]
MSYEDIAVKLDEIEAELRKLGFLDAFVGSPTQVRSAFGYQQMPFEQWLVAVFLPNARQALVSKDLPKSSQVSVAAIRNFDGYDEADTLISLLCGFDAAINSK